MKVKLITSAPFNKSASGNTLIAQPPLPPGVDELIKSMPERDRIAYEENPLRLYEAANYKEKPTSLSFNILWQMSVKNSVVAAVLNTRINQVSTFTRPARFSPDGIGYEIRLRDPHVTPNEEQQRMAIAIETFLERCGYNEDFDRDGFDTFMRKVTRDSLTYDQLCFEVVPDRQGYPAEFFAVDAATIRAASEEYQPLPGVRGSDEKVSDLRWVQVIDGEIKAWFTSKELAFGVRNPRTHILMQPYGFSELEMLIQQVTSHLYAEEYNSRYFSQGGTTKGILNLKTDPNGVANREQLVSFKRQWQAQVEGMTGAWKTPVVQIPNGIEYINVNQSNRDMEFSAWMTYLINIVCAIYQIDPAEVNFANNGGAGEQSSVFESSQEQKLKNSKDKGLKPLLRFLESCINKWIVSRFSSDYVFAFTGIDEHTDMEKADLYNKQVHAFRTINEIRRECGMEPLEDGDTILDPTLLNQKLQKEMMEQQAAMGQSPGMVEGADGADATPLETPQADEPIENEGAEYDAYLTEESGEDYTEKSLTRLIFTETDD